METIKVKGMSCQHCVQAVTKALNGIEGLKNVQVDLDSGQASFDKDKPVDLETVKAAVKDAGYEAED
jgi:copper chaperone